MTDAVLLVGTRKGLFIGRRRGEAPWEFDGPHFNAQAVYAVAVDRRGPVPRLLVGGDSAHWGPSVFSSDDLGATWREPAAPAVKFPKDTGASLERVWQLQPAGPEAPTWCTRGRNRPRCSARPTGATPSSWSARCGSTRAAGSGYRVAGARACTR